MMAGHIKLTLFFLSISLVVPYAFALPVPVINYTMDGLAITDTSGNSYDGSPTGVTFGHTGILGNAIFCDGTNDYINITHNITQIQESRNLTVSVWVQPFDAGVFEDIYISSSPLEQTGERVFLQRRDSNDYFLQTTGAGASVYGETDFNAGWQMLTGVISGENLTVYYNGTMENSTTSAITTNITIMRANLCQYFGPDTTRRLNALVDEFLLFNESLTPEEVEFIYNTTVGIQPTTTTTTTTTLISQIQGIETLVGVEDAGDETSTWLAGDTDYYNVSEVTGTPGFTIRFNFTDVSNLANQLNYSFLLDYDGAAGHTVVLQFFNYTSGLFETFDSFTDGIGQWVNGTINDANDLISSNLVTGQFNHTSPGNMNHNIALDFGLLSADATTSTTTTTTSTTTTTTIPSTALIRIHSGGDAYYAVDLCDPHDITGCTTFIAGTPMTINSSSDPILKLIPISFNLNITSFNNVSSSNGNYLLRLFLNTTLWITLFTLIISAIIVSAMVWTIIRRN